MPTPTSYTPIVVIPFSGDSRIDTLMNPYLRFWGPAVNGVTEVTYSFAEANSVWSSQYPSNYPFQGFEALDGAERNLFQQCLASFEDVANINFTQVIETPDSVGTIRVGQSTLVGAEGAAGLAYYSTGAPQAGDIFFDDSLGATEEPRFQFWRLAMLHEIGHAVGLKHPFDNGQTLPAQFDNERYTVMSYTSANNAGAHHPTTLMLFDILALQYVYGANMTTGTGDDRYLFELVGEFRTIWDAGGNDWFDCSLQVLNCMIDLNDGHFSSIGARWSAGNITLPGNEARDNIAIAFGATIENALGGSRHDRLIGNAVANILDGGQGNDTLEGGDGNDTLIGGLGNNLLSGGAGDDTYYITNFLDIAQETASGDNGNDRVYSSVNYTTGAGIEELILTGTAFVGYGNELNNVIIGTADYNILIGGAGDDTLDSRGGIDFLRGGSGNDTYYVDHLGRIEESIPGSSGIDTVYANFTNFARTANSTLDYTLVDELENLSFEFVARNIYNYIRGNGSDNNLTINITGYVPDPYAFVTIEGGDGSDVINILSVSGDGSGTLIYANGGSGNDRISIDVSAPFTSSTGWMNGGSGDDYISGGNGHDIFSGDSGTDTLIGGGGDDDLSGYALTGRVPSPGADGVDSLVGGTGNDDYSINIDDVIVEFAGEGYDRVFLSDSRSGSYTMAANIEELLLGYFQNAPLQIYGNELNNLINANQDGRTASVTLAGGLGNDTLSSATVGDLLIMDQGEDIARVLDYDAELRGTSGVITVSGFNAANEDLLDITGFLLDFPSSTTPTYEKGISWDFIGNQLWLDSDGDHQLDRAWVVFENLVGTLDRGDVIFFARVVPTGSGGAFLYRSENATLTGGNDIYTATGSDDSIYGGLGADSIIGGGGNDYLVAGAADDLSNNTLRGGLGADSLFGGSGHDSLSGGTGSDLLQANGGNDSLDGGAGDDVLQGGTGNDYYIVNSILDRIEETVNNGLDIVEASINYTLAASLENLILVAGAIQGTGNSENNSIAGNSSDNILDGLAGIDTLAGGAGNDIYYVDNGNDIVVESANAGGDHVFATVSYTLGANVENLTLTAGVSAVGNSLNNVIYGNNVSSNSIDGGVGADTVYGGGGNDYYLMDNINDRVIEDDAVTSAAGFDPGRDTVEASINYTLGSNLEALVLAGTAVTGVGNNLDNLVVGNGNNNSLEGASGRDTLDGGFGNDRLDGGTGDDSLVGGAGNDFYIVDTGFDRVVEAVSPTGGVDTVQSSAADYSLVEGTEHLILAVGALNGGGNQSNNSIIGNAADNILDGGSGVDTLIGYGGNDSYVVDNINDVIIEGANEGFDQITSVIDYTLGANIENLWISFGVVGVGNSGNNLIRGNHYFDNILNGGAGSDSLYGAGGNDYYIVDNVGDQVFEEDLLAILAGANPGRDTVESSISYVLGSNLEALILTGSALQGFGNGLDNLIQGNGSGNILLGDTGYDTLIGGGGSDQVFGGMGDDYLDLRTSTADYDYIEGGQGSDTLVLTSNAGGYAEIRFDDILDGNGQIVGVDRIENFQAEVIGANAKDILNIGGLLSALGYAETLSARVYGDAYTVVQRGIGTYDVSIDADRNNATGAGGFETLLVRLFNVTGTLDYTDFVVLPDF